ncbi:MAG: RelA/SpoT family protein [Cardiobacteriaceae bacterium]|nr:RelA/SpoT family protein [Cardiobacteriaceae bacterium]
MMPLPLALEYQPFAIFSGADILQAAYNELHEELEKYLEPNDIEKVLRCAIYGAAAHEGQKRQSGEPYFIHPIAVCRILARQRFDLPVLQAGLLHDVLEDTVLKKTDMAAEFGEEVTRLVDGVSKLDRLKKTAPQAAVAESFKKMFLATADDPRVLIIKLADRLHNMQTLGALRREKQRRIARETLDIYASIAGRLGLFYFRIQLEDLAFSYLYPWRHAVLRKHYLERFSHNETLDRVRNALQPRLQELGIKASINKRQRHLWGVYQRMKRKQTFEEACRTVPIRIITDNEDKCYRILGCLHALYRPIHGKFEDYIAAPKSNGYRSLHTSVLMPRQKVLNVQIRTRDMHTLAEAGIISVWHQYAKQRAVQIGAQNIEAEKTIRGWLSRLTEVQSITDDPLEFYDAIKKELISGGMHVYTPAGEVVDLPHNATPVDFAYAIHTDIGDHCIAAKVNNQPYPIYKKLELAQTVEIITSPEAHPHAGWLQFVVTAKARAGINHYLNEMARNDAQTLGKRLLNNAFYRLGHKFENVSQTRWQQYLNALGINEETLLTEIGHGLRQAGLIAAALLEGKKKIPQEDDKSRLLEVHSAFESGITLAECCYPLPQEPIIGQIVKGMGIFIHSQDCPLNSMTGNKEDWIQATWAKERKGLFPCLLEIEARNRPRLLANVSSIIADTEANISDFNMTMTAHDNDLRTLKVWIEVHNREHLAQIIRRLRSINNVIHIRRIVRS